LDVCRPMDGNPTGTPLPVPVPVPLLGLVDVADDKEAVPVPTGE